MSSNVLLIAEDTLKTYSNLNKNTFGDWILPAIREAQEMGLMPIIGECLYNKICELVADGSINDVLFTAYKDLLDDKIQPYLIYKTLSNIIPILNAKMANLGVVVTNDEHVVNLTQSESDLLKAYYSERCDFYTKRLQDFIKSNQSAFPEISCGCGKMQPNLESSENSVGVWLGGSRGKKIGNNNNCICSSTEVTHADYQSGFTDGVEFQKRKLEITAVTENGRYIREDGYSEVVVDVPQTGHTEEELKEAYQNGKTVGVSEQKSKLSAVTITQNGDYNREDGYSTVTVNVAQTGHTDEEMTEQYQSGYTSGETHQKALLSAITITQNGSYERENGYSAVTVDVAGQEPSLQTLSVTANGEYFPEQGYDGFSSVEVNVPTGSTINNQDKNITITANTATTITYDNGYTGLERVTVNINVPQTGASGDKINISDTLYLNEYGRYYFDYNSATTAASMEIVFAKSPTPTPTGETEQYLTFDILSDGDIILYNDESTNNKTIYYSVNDGDWVTVTINPSKIYINLRNGDKIRLKGNNESYNGNKIKVDTNANVYGNIMSLIYGDNFVGQITLPSEMNFSYIFSGSKIVNAANLILPATTLAPYCYDNMFRDCTLLTTAPALPATALTYYCYYNMFQGCTSLTTAPELPATTLSQYCYHGMFEYCTSLTTAPALPATTLASACYKNMFQGCTKLTTAPALPATTLASDCYQQMFYNCTSLTTVPKLPATTLEHSCYSYMFANCVSLTIAPALPATTLANDCYGSMFRDCTSLTTAPELPSTTLADWCYRNMFYGCSSLNYIKCLATDISATSPTLEWVSGIAATGTFVKHPNATWWETGISGIPTGWTVVDNS